MGKIINKIINRGTLRRPGELGGCPPERSEGRALKIAVLVSGGVDSSVALALLKEQGHEVTAFYLKIWLEDELSYLADCPWEEDLSYVRQVCAQLDVPLEIISLQQEYRDEVVGYTIREVKAGRTPNPDILCNKRIKFGLFLDKIDSKFEKVATGHYAQIEHFQPSHKASADRLAQTGAVALKMAPDPIKDQTYFLSHLSQAQFARAMFPIGHLQKFQVRELAQHYNLPNKDRKDSQGICFLGKFKYRDFIKHYLGEMPGDLIEHETGEKLGRHEGFWFYTVGQRQGIGLSGGPWYVVAKDCEKNVVFISREYYSADKVRNTFEVDNINLIGVDDLSSVRRDPSQAQGERGKNSLDIEQAKKFPISEHGVDSLLSVRPDTSCAQYARPLSSVPGPSRRWAKDIPIYVKMRHGPELKECIVENLGNGIMKVILADDDQGIAAGQYAVFYTGDICIGSGIIRQS